MARFRRGRRRSFRMRRGRVGRRRIARGRRMGRGLRTRSLRIGYRM